MRVNSATGSITSMNASSYAFRAVPPPMPPPDDTYPDDPFDIPLPPAPAVPSRPLPPSGPPLGLPRNIPTVSNHQSREEEEDEDQPQNLVLVPLGSTPVNLTDVIHRH